MLPKPEDPAIARKTTKHFVHILIIMEKENDGDYLIPIVFFEFLVKLAIVYQVLKVI